MTRRSAPSPPERDRPDTTDEQARVALERLRQRVHETTDLPSPSAQAALAIVAELERLLDLHS